MLMFDDEAITEQLKRAVLQYKETEKPSRRDQFFTIRLTKGEFDELKDYATKLGVSASELARTGISLVSLCLAIIKGVVTDGEDKEI